jgi:hypothetical protein
MFTFPASSTHKPVRNSGAHGRPTADDAAKIARVIMNLHGILIDPNAAPGAATAAKRTLLALPARTRHMHWPQMIVPPLAVMRSGETARSPRRPVPRKRILRSSVKPRTFFASRKSPAVVRGSVLASANRAEFAPRAERASLARRVPENANFLARNHL